ncbi:hypothetical protein BT69DRAFT_1351207 [Atractiella rhizophila]|nr:hypothetical protein BT69DRAFT_1351207 [Atractiella rhizophila]
MDDAVTAAKSSKRFLGCSSWRHGEEHRYQAIPHDVDNDLFLHLVAKNGELPPNILMGLAALSGSCSTLVNSRSGLKWCPFPHIVDTKVVQVELQRNACDVTIRRFFPSDGRTKLFAYLLKGIHNHPPPAPSKITPGAREQVEKLVRARGVAGATVSNLKRAAITKQALGHRTMAEAIHPSLNNNATLARIIRDLRKAEYPMGEGIEGIRLIWHQQRRLPSEQRYVQDVQDFVLEGGRTQTVVTCFYQDAASALLSARYVVLDRSFKGVEGGQWQELSGGTLMQQFQRFLCAFRIFSNAWTRQAFYNIFSTLWKLLQMATGQKARFFFDSFGILLFLLDAEAAQLVGLADSLVELAPPMERAPEWLQPLYPLSAEILIDIVGFFKLCTVHANRGITEVARFLPEVEATEFIGRAKGFRQLSDYRDREDFMQWCRVHHHVKVQQWQQDKDRFPWKELGYNRFASNVPLDHWMTTPNHMNEIESSHHRTYHLCGTGLSFIHAVISRAEVDRELLQEFMLDSLCGVASRPSNTHLQAAIRNNHRTDSRNYRAQAVAEKRKAAQLEDRLEVLEQDRASLQQLLITNGIDIPLPHSVPLSTNTSSSSSRIKKSQTCSKCGGVGHNKNNRSCPRYGL